jgi:serine/threonine protein kinase/formylglycine-generating enzyme required for sulfatase activity
MPANQTPGTLPTQFGRYRILKKLGAGGMGAVYLAEDTRLGRQVALKVPNLGAEETPEDLQRFHREARLAATLHHPHICPIHDVDCIDGITFLTMAFIAGQPLADCIDPERPMPQHRAATLVRQMALALQEAHAKGILHRDLKPSNVMLDARGEPIIMDFGLAITAEGSEKRLTRTGYVLGTPEYMAPEQLQGDRKGLTPQCDVYSLGVILYELLTGRVPFTGAPVEVLAKVLTKKAPRPSAFRKDIDKALESICLRAIAKKPAERYATMAELAAALADYLGRKPASQPPPLPQGRDASSPAAPTAPVRPTAVTPTAPLPGKPSTRKRWLGAAILLLAVGAASASLLWMGFLGRPPTTTKVGLPPPGPAETAGLPPANPQPKKTEAKDNSPDLLDCLLGVSREEVERKQKAWAAYLGRQVEEEVEIADGVKMTFVLVPPGKFRMGSPPDEEEREAVEFLHEVTLTEPFYLGKTEVTQKQYKALGVDNPSKFKGDDLPVEMVSWEEATTWAEKLTKKRGDKHLYRLPTEAEWEYSCRGGRSSSKPFGIGDGRALTSSEANFDGNYPYGGADKGPYVKATCAVGSYKPNALGLHDMHGNVWEWCQDGYGLYPNPTVPAEGSLRVGRGGSWSYGGMGCRAASRGRFEPGLRSDGLGFRLARSSPSGVNK